MARPDDRDDTLDMAQMTQLPNLARLTWHGTDDTAAKPDTVEDDMADTAVESKMAIETTHVS